MLTFVFNIELLQLNPQEEYSDVNIEFDTVEIEAVDEKIATDLLLEKYTIVTNFLHQGLANVECIGTIQSETF
jgi:hypothetical protein